VSLFHVETEGLEETKAAFDELRKGLDAIDAGELRAASVEASTELAARLRAAASSSGVPVAPRVAQSVRPKLGGWPGVTIGGGVPVGRRGAIAAKLLWGSETGPAGDPNHFAVAPNAAGYWITPTTKAFKSGPGMARFRDAVDKLIHRTNLD
jgi:hypothetical protein